MSCIFCKIVSKEIPAEILYENEKAIAILDINPIHFGHALIIPKNHSKNFLDVNKSDLQGIFEAAQIIGNAIFSGLKLEGFNFFSNIGEIAGQSIFHFHIHITPRYSGDNIKFFNELKKYHGNQLKEFSTIIRDAIKK